MLIKKRLLAGAVAAAATSDRVAAALRAETRRSVYWQGRRLMRPEKRESPAQLQLSS